MWRSRRLLIAEGAEIRAGTEFAEWHAKESQMEDAAEFPSVTFNGGLVRRISNPEALGRCIDLLEQLKNGIEQNGFDADWDKTILEKIYGVDDEDGWQETLFSSYVLWLNTSLASDEERQEKRFASPQESKDNFLTELNDEIK